MTQTEGFMILILIFSVPFWAIAAIEYVKSINEQIKEWKVEAHANRIAGYNKKRNKRY